MKTTHFGFVLGGWLLSLAACGSKDLQGVCEEAQAEDCTSISDCAKASELGLALAEASGCTSQYDAYADCATGVDDVCTIDATCSGETDAFGICVAPYCLENLAECEAFAEASGL
jgi:hypothetical protein